MVHATSTRKRISAEMCKLQQQRTTIPISRKWEEKRKVLQRRVLQMTCHALPKQEENTTEEYLVFTAMGVCTRRSFLVELENAPTCYRAPKWPRKPLLAEEPKERNFFCTMFFQNPSGHGRPQVQIKHVQSFNIKNFGAPETSPPQILYVWPFSCILKGKGGPEHEDLRGQTPLEGWGSRRGGFVSKLFMFMPFFGTSVPKIMDVLHQKCVWPAGPVRNYLTPGHQGQESPQDIQTEKSMFMVSFPSQIFVF